MQKLIHTHTVSFTEKYEKIEKYYHSSCHAWKYSITTNNVIFLYNCLVMIEFPPSCYISKRQELDIWQCKLTWVCVCLCVYVCVRECVMFVVRVAVIALNSPHLNLTFSHWTVKQKAFLYRSLPTELAASYCQRPPANNLQQAGTKWCSETGCVDFGLSWLIHLWTIMSDSMVLLLLYGKGRNNALINR